MTGSTEVTGAAIEGARRLVDQATDLYRSDPAVLASLAELRDRLDEPLRVALVGSVKAGKSTLLNALLGEHLAPTDARECTKVITWYRHATTPSVRARHIIDGYVALPLLRQDARLELDLGHLDADAVEWLDVAWPASPLADLTLIDTPGTASISATLSDRTQQFVTPGGGVSGADAIVYLLRSLHSSDVEFLRSFNERANGESSMGAIAVLSRADELGAGRLNAMGVVGRAVDKLRGDPTLDGACEAIVPVAGLLALAGETLRQSEFTTLVALEALPPDELKRLLVSADRFITVEGTEGLPPPRVRAELMNRFGLFGIRLAVTMIRGGARDAPALAQQLVEHSGLEELRRVIDVHFRRRHPQLKAHALVLALQQLVRDNPSSQSAEILAAMDEQLADPHPFDEVRLLGRVRSARLALDRDDLDELERILGGHGTSSPERLGVKSSHASGKLRREALTQLRKWHGLATNPLVEPDTAAACRVAARSCEGILAEIEIYD